MESEANAPAVTQEDTFVFPKTPTKTVVRVSNIAQSVTGTQLRTFFTFCGDIKQFALRPG